ncbi:MAG: prohibitin family protein [Gammaproteobacteria bacterium]|nr:prohibitin family protein [Gammaproteobacteria bacterium]
MGDDARRAARRWVIAVLVVCSLLLVLRSKPILVVPAGQRAVVFNVLTGVEDRVLGEGYRFFLPLLQYPELFDVRTQSYTMSSTPEDHVDVDPNPLVALTADGQPVTLDLTVLYHPAPEKLPQLYREIGNRKEYTEKIVRPELRALLRMVVARYTVTQLYSGNREALERACLERIGAAFAKSYLVLEEVKLRNLTFSKQFQETIEAKQVAQQQVQRMKYGWSRLRRKRRRPSSRPGARPTPSASWPSRSAATRR